VRDPVGQHRHDRPPSRCAPRSWTDPFAPAL
jgi:hypothetical protein